MYIRQAATTFKCASCKGPILHKEPCMTTGTKEAHGPSICMRCLREAVKTINEKSEWRNRGWHFLSTVKYKEPRCNICENIIPMGSYVWISKYHKMILERGRPVPLNETTLDYVCPHCIQEFISNIPQQTFDDSDAKVLEKLLKKM
ncbi:MAG TPA: hypothetical protein P5136_01455 [Methanofastidiosum sp.]|nr:hypothetical protein [Methanofastidiosum sp.]